MERRVNDAELHQFFRIGDYGAVIALLGNVEELDVRQAAVLGIALLRTGNFAACELPLASAMAQGDTEAAVEYGNMLRATNQHGKAIRHFERLLPTLSGELRFRALRWYGVSLSAVGNPNSLDIVEEARLGYLGLRDDLTAARISHTLAALLLTRGEFRQAKQILDHAVPALEVDPNRRPLLNAYHTLIEVQLEVGYLEEAADTLHRAEAIAHELHDDYAELHVAARRTLLRLKQGDYGAFASQLVELRQRAEALGEYEIYTFASNNLANHLSRTGDHVSALRVLAELTERTPTRSLETMLVSAMLTLRRGNAPEAMGQLLAVRTKAQEQGIARDATRATLLASLAAYKMNDFDTALRYLAEALTELAGWPTALVQVSLRQELRELEELIAHARLTPDLQPVISAALERTTGLVISHADDLFGDVRLLEINVLGKQPLVLLDGSPLSFRLTYSVPILAYLALHPHRTRQEITADLWGDQDAVRAGANFRQCLAEIRRVAGADLIVMDGPHREPRYSLSQKVTIQVDALRVRQLLHHGDMVAALSAYKGLFLAQLEETEWLQEMRSTLTNSLTLMLRRAIEAATAQGDDRRVVLLATAVLEIDPDDLEVEERRLECAQRVCSPVEIARFQAQRYRRLN